jgi:hypothetical protein
MTTLAISKPKLAIGSLLDELNDRARIYNQVYGWSVERSQQQALKDFSRFITDDIVPLAIADMPDANTYFKQIDVVEKKVE